MLSANDFAGLEQLFGAFVAGIPGDWFRKKFHRPVRGQKVSPEGLPIHLIGVEFSREQRTLVGFEVESLP